MNIRPMRRGDLMALSDIDPNFTSEGYLDVEVMQEGLETSFRLVEKPFTEPFSKKMGYNYSMEELANTRYRLEEGNALQLVVEVNRRLVGVLEVEEEAWRQTALIWALFLDKEWRGQGLGRTLLERARGWAQARSLRALVLETQTNNLPALRFYLKQGFHIAGLDLHFYTNTDVARHETALFLYQLL